MPDYFSQYSGIAANAANQYGIPQPIFFGLIQQESSWNPNASPGTTSAFGFTQLTKAAAAQVGVNQYDPTQNLYGGAAYLASMPGNTWGEKLAHYYQGPGANIGQSGLNYAQSVLKKAESFITGSGNGPSTGTVASGAACAASGGTDVMACASAAGGLLGFGGSGDQCGSLDFVCKLQQWMSKSEFFTRLALASLALLFILGGLYLMKGNE
jgi:hypothetical protein